jgi:dTDP-4-dehydrorhamnose 3,5-epimerase-like enzyme
LVLSILKNPELKLSDIKLVELPKILDERGNLSFIEHPQHLPFEIRRAYWIYDVPGGEKRGGHAYTRLNELILALSGSFDVELDDGRGKKTYTLNRSYTGLLVPQMIWRSLSNFSTNALCLILASGEYNESDYIREYPDFISAKLKETAV